MHLVRRPHLLIQLAVHAVTDAKLLVVRLDVDVAGVLPHGVVEQVVDQLDHRRLPRHLLQIADVLRDVLDEREFLESLVIEDVVDHEDVRRRQVRLERGLDVLRRRANDLDLASADSLDLIDQEDVGRLADGHGQRAVHFEQGQNDVGFDELARQDLHDLRIADFRAHLGIRHAVGFRQRRGDLVLGAVAHLDEQLTEQLAMALVPLLGQGLIDLLLSDDAPGQQ